MMQLSEELLNFMYVLLVNEKVSAITNTGYSTTGLTAPILHGYITEVNKAIKEIYKEGK